MRSAIMIVIIFVLIALLLRTTVLAEKLVEITQYIPIGTYRDNRNNDITKYCAIMNDYSVRCIDVPVIK